jgi:hypothetical protein
MFILKNQSYHQHLSLQFKAVPGALMERGHPVRQRAQHAQRHRILVPRCSRFALRRTGCPRSINAASTARFAHYQLLEYIRQLLKRA